MAQRVLCVLGCYFFLALINTSIHGALQQNSDSDDRQNHMKALSELNNDFAFRLYKSIASGDRSQNVFFSPLSVSTALAALSLGAGGDTHQQLLSGLGFNSSVFTSEEMHRAFLDLLLNLNQRTDLNVGTALYINKTFKPHPEFLENLKSLYLSEGFSVNFNKHKETAKQINKYVSEKTQGKIKKFIKVLDQRTVMYLLSYIYFKGKWSTAFNPQNTRKSEFQVDAETSVPVELMYQRNDFYGYFDKELSTIVLRLDYNVSFSMILALPIVHNLSLLEKALQPQLLANWERKMRRSKYAIFLPKLSLKTSYCLIKILNRIGIRDLFTENANFTGITDEQVYVSEALHKATLDVDEEGATATGLTSMRFGARSGPLPIYFNTPFLIFITDQETKNILFMGKIVNPKNSEITE